MEHINILWTRVITCSWECWVSDYIRDYLRHLARLIRITILYQSSIKNNTEKLNSNWTNKRKNAKQLSKLWTWIQDSNKYCVIADTEPKKNSRSTKTVAMTRIRSFENCKESHITNSDSRINHFHQTTEKDLRSRSCAIRFRENWYDKNIFS